MKKLVLLSALLATAVSLNGQIRNDDVYKLTHCDQTSVRNEIVIPGFDGYHALKCDLHIHTVFSDGEVWPTVRVTEAWRDGLDAIAMTDHIEYRPKEGWVKGDLNESFKIAKKKADEIGFILIQGIEITRAKPLGHLNALFINDANPMKVEDPLEALEIALKQGAYIQWNHPGWPDNKSTMYPVHEELLKAGKIHAVEVLNYMEYYPLVFDWIGKYNLAPTANTDIHEAVSVAYGRSEEKLRPMTLVFASDRSEQALKEALFAKRTVAFFDGMLVGKPEYLAKLAQASLKVRMVREGLAEVTNISDIPFEATNNGNLYIFPAGKTARVYLPKDGELVFKNCFVGMHKNLTIPYEAWSSFLR